ncbi:MAG: T9SS type A sorting domain-containing protein [Bacteroidetes bacterium]|nr:T9SS type A sorting domain-containing protein [Bacteroidota bacterium]
MKRSTQFFYITSFRKPKSIAQYSNKVWCFGDSAGVIFTNSVTYFSTGESSLSASVSIANAQDSLLFYGSSVHPAAYINGWKKNGRLKNKLHQTMQNGDSLICLGWYHDMIIVPKSVTDSSFYVFLAGVSGPYFGLYYCIVDLKLNNGLGVVTQKNVMLDPVSTKDALMAVKHGNGKDWWLVTRKWDYPNAAYDNAFYVYLVDSTGIYPHPVQNVGTMRASNGGDIVFNSNGTKFAESDWGNLIELYDFDRCTGIISSPLNIELPSTTGPFKYYVSACFSPNNRFLYVLGNLNGFDDARIFQYDLLSGNISNSKITIGMIQDSASAVMMKLAPDNRIYISALSDIPGGGYPYPANYYNYVNTHLSVINYPDSAGLSSDFQLLSFPLAGHRTYRGLPHNPNYEMGPLVGSPCDTLTVGITENDEKNEVFFQAWYNSEWNMIHVNASKLKGKSGVLRLFDVEGRVVVDRKVSVINGGYFTTEIFMNGIAAGVYIVSLVTEKDKVQGKIMKF